MLAQEYGAESVFVVDGYDIEGSIERYRSLPASESDRIAVFAGHMPFGWHEVVDGPVRYITMLREPVERVISHYRYVARTPEAAFHDQAASLSLEAYATNSPGAAFFNNGQTRLLSGPLLRRGEALDRDDLVRATRNLEQHFCVVGTTERFDESLLLMKRRLGWRTPYYESVNVGPEWDRHESEQALEVVASLNRFDAELYRLAAARLEADLGGAVRVSATTRIFRLGNRLHEVARERATLRGRMRRFVRRVSRRFRSRRGVRSGV